MSAGRSASTSAARSPTPCSPRPPVSSPAKVPTTPADQSEGVMAAVALVLERAGIARAGGRELRPRHDGRDERAAGGARRAHRAARDRGIHRRAGDRAPDAAGAVPALPRASRRRWCRPSCASPWRSAAIPRACCARSTTRRPRGHDRAPARRARRLGRRLPAALLCAPGARAPRGARRRARRCRDVHVSASHELVSVFREYERTSTTVIDAYLSPLLRGYLEPARPSRRGPPACRSRRSCARAAG